MTPTPFRIGQRVRMTELSEKLHDAIEEMGKGSVVPSRQTRVELAAHIRTLEREFCRNVCGKAGEHINPCPSFWQPL